MTSLSHKLFESKYSVRFITVYFLNFLYSQIIKKKIGSDNIIQFGKIGDVWIEGWIMRKV